MAVGMALAESMLAAHFNTPDYKIVDHYTYALVGEGCLMEGVSSEASSFAGTNKLGKLIVFYDENYITIDGSTNLAFTEDVAKRYEAYGWPPAAKPAGPGTKVESPLPGVIIEVSVKEGQAVKMGQKVAGLEAMKMENEIAATADGTVTAIHVAKGDSVLEGAPIVTIA